MSDQIQVTILGQETLVTDESQNLVVTVSPEVSQPVVSPEVIATATAVEQQISVTVSEVTTPLINQESWINLVMRWLSAPSLVYQSGSLLVYEYEHEDATRYRRVPDPYDPAQDSFFSTFNSPTLSGLICSRA
jgi:CRISPR/Cas system endoribonuclease Cas6 (RAMP superfamily)